VLAHEFHHSSLDRLPHGQRFAYRVERGHGIDGAHDGLLHRNLLASYSHLRGAGWAARFVAFVRQVGIGHRTPATATHAEPLVA
jgi:cobyrinic acid a,c-diamide synthase